MNPETIEIPDTERCVIELTHPTGVIPDFLVPLHEKTLKDTARALGVLDQLHRDNIKIEVGDPVEVADRPDTPLYRQITVIATLSGDLRTAFTDALLASGYALAPERQPLRIHPEGEEADVTEEREAM